MPDREPVFIEALADEEHLVRLEGAKALNNVPDREAVPLLLARLRDPDEHLDVRIAAAEALRHYPRFEVMSALMDLLLHRQFGLAWQARQSLIHLTGQDHRYDIPAWRAHLAS